MPDIDVAIVQAILKRDSGVPTDSSVNTWHFGINAATFSAAIAQEIAERVRDFYIVNPTGEPNNVFSQLGDTLATTGHEVKVYALKDAKPRPIRYQLTFGGTTGTSSYPAEIAVALSYQGEKAAGLPQARNRGRIFLGPIPANTNVVGGDQRVPATTRTRFAAAASDLEDKNDVDSYWCVYSPTRDAEDPAGYHPVPVTNGWIDDAYDVVRSRGAKTTTRTLWT